MTQCQISAAVALGTNINKFQYLNFLSLKCIWKYRLQNFYHFVPGPMSQVLLIEKTVYHVSWKIWGAVISSLFIALTNALAITMSTILGVLQVYAHVNFTFLIVICSIVLTIGESGTTALSLVCFNRFRLKIFLPSERVSGWNFGQVGIYSFLQCTYPGSLCTKQ